MHTLLLWNRHAVIGAADPWDFVATCSWEEILQPFVPRIAVRRAAAEVLVRLLVTERLLGRGRWGEDGSLLPWYDGMQLWDLCEAEDPSLTGDPVPPPRIVTAEETLRRLQAQEE